MMMMVEMTINLVPNSLGLDLISTTERVNEQYCCNSVVIQKLCRLYEIPLTQLNYVGK